MAHTRLIPKRFRLLCDVIESVFEGRQIPPANLLGTLPQARERVFARRLLQGLRERPRQVATAKQGWLNQGKRVRFFLDSNVPTAGIVSPCAFADWFLPKR